jgi:hypothetical protein
MNLYISIDVFICIDTYVSIYTKTWTRIIHIFVCINIFIGRKMQTYVNKKILICIPASKVESTPGFRTLITTSVPSRSLALWT